MGRKNEWRPAPDTDVANAIRLQRALHPHVAYTHGIGWLRYRNGVHQLVEESEIRAILQDLLPQLVHREAADASQQAAASTDKRERRDLADQADALTRWAKRCEMRTTLQAALDLYRDRATTPLERWDAHPNLLNTANGVLNLGTGTLDPHDPNLYLTQQAPTTFDPNASHPAVDTLVALLQQDAREPFLRRAFGSALTAERHNEILLYMVGRGGTGKTTLVQALLTTLGTYASTIDPGILIQGAHTNPSRPRPELLHLRNLRLAIGYELPEGARFNAPDIKSITGGDTLTARALYQNQLQQIAPHCLLALHSNHDLAAAWNDDGMKRRVIKIPFDTRPNHADSTIKRALQHDPQARAALLAWLYTGYCEWAETNHDLTPPQTIQRATHDYWIDQDPCAEWATARLDFDGHTFTYTADLYQSYSTWTELNGEQPISKKALGKWLARQPGLRARRAHGNRGWHGVRINNGRR